MGENLQDNKDENQVFNLTTYFQNLKEKYVQANFKQLWDLSISMPSMYIFPIEVSLVYRNP